MIAACTALHALFPRPRDDAERLQEAALAARARALARARRVKLGRRRGNARSAVVPVGAEPRDAEGDGAGEVDKVALNRTESSSSISAASLSAANSDDDDDAAPEADDAQGPQHRKRRPPPVLRARVWRAVRPLRVVRSLLDELVFAGATALLVLAACGATPVARGSGNRGILIGALFMQVRRLASSARDEG